MIIIKKMRIFKRLLKSQNNTVLMLFILIGIDFFTQFKSFITIWILFSGLIIFLLLLLSIYLQYRNWRKLKIGLFLITSFIEITNIFVRYWN